MSPLSVRHLALQRDARRYGVIRDRLACLSIVLLVCGTHVPSAHGAQQATTNAEQYYYLALEAQSARDFPEMLRTLRLAGEGGNMQAQEMLAMVLIAGEKLYGKHIQANLCEAQMWTRRAAVQGSEIGMFQLMLLNRAAQARRAADLCGPGNTAKVQRP